MNLLLIEKRRLSHQNRLDSAKSREQRNVLGQFATPPNLANDILNFVSLNIKSDLKIKFLDPAFGTGSFYSSLLTYFPPKKIIKAVAYEIDPEFFAIANDIWSQSSIKIFNENYVDIFDSEEEQERFNLIICNPPYVRHHHILKEQKIQMKELIAEKIGIKISGLAGLYCYFLLLSHLKVEQNGYCAWLIPSEFLDVNYGVAIKQYLLRKVKLIRIHRYNPKNLQFRDALVSSSIVWFQNSLPLQNDKIQFSYGNDLNNPERIREFNRSDLELIKKWTPLFHIDQTKVETSTTLSEWFKIKRGVATGANSFFIINLEDAMEMDIPISLCQPILPSPRYLSTNQIFSDQQGFPELSQKLVLLNINLEMSLIKIEYPKLFEYLVEGEKKGVNGGYLLKRRIPWYKQEYREPTQLLCTYMGRGENNVSPFRFILNNSNAIATNSYLMLYPNNYLKKILNNDPSLIDKIWKKLNETSSSLIKNEGRFYGGGLHKIEPKELGNLPCDWMFTLII